MLYYINIYKMPHGATILGGRKDGSAMIFKKEKKKEPEKKPTAQQAVVLYIHDLIYMFLVLMLLFTGVFRLITVSGSSMFDTLWDGDRLVLLGNVFYREPKQGDVVVLAKRAYDNGKPIIKRVIATEGQTVDVDFAQGIVYVDGVALEEDYIYSPTTVSGDMSFPLTVAEGHIFVMGDNRGVSKDSRYRDIGQIDQREILGKAILLAFPGTHKGRLNRDFGRIGWIQ